MKLAPRRAERTTCSGQRWAVSLLHGGEQRGCDRRYDRGVFSFNSFPKQSGVLFPSCRADVLAVERLFDRVQFSSFPR